MKLKPYPKYKESGIQWIGEIPEDWEVNKIKHNVLPLEKSGVEAAEGDEEGKYPFFTSSQIQNKFIDKEIFDKECLILGTGGTACVHYYNGKFSASTDCLVLKKQEDINMKFLFYYVLSNIEIIDDLGFWGMGLRHLQKYFFYNMLIYWPSKDEQKQIINFLDSKTSEIDQTIEKDKELIELLKEKRTALINHVVTKGLDPKAKMKDSGIDWIGEIPEGWTLNRLKFLLDESKGSIKTGPFGSQLTTDEMEDSEYKVYNQKNVIDKDEKNGENYISEQKYKELISFKAGAGDILITTRGTIGRCLKLSKDAEDGILHPCLMKIKVNDKKILNKYAELLIESSDLVSIQFMLQSNATTIGVIYQDNLKEISLPVPPLDTQKRILQHLNKTTSKIDQTINKIQEKIKLTEEYKKSLIHHVVTGKVDVREAVA